MATTSEAELLLQAAEGSERGVEYKLPSAKAAVRMRNNCYNIKRRTGKFSNLMLRIEGAKLLVLKKDQLLDKMNMVEL